MKTAKPVEKDSKVQQSQTKNQRQKEPSVIPLSEVEVGGVQTQKSEESKGNSGSGNLNGSIVSVHGSQTIYDQGSEIMYGKLQESLAQTGDINHPDTKEIEKGYMTTLNIDQARDYNDLKSGTYLPKTVQEQAANHQESKKDKEVKPKQKAKSVSKGKTDASLADLSSSPATQLVSGFNTVQNSSTALLNSQTEKAKGELPKVNAKIGSAFSGSKAKGKAGKDKTVAKSGKKTVKSATQKPKSKEVSFPQSEPLKKVSYSFNSAGAKNGTFERQAHDQLRGIQLNTSAIPTKMQQSANLDLSGEADTEHLSIEQNDAAQDMGIKKNQAAKDIHKDYGENSIIKKPNDETLKSSRKITSKAVKKQPIDALKLDGIDEASINAQFEPIIQSKIGAETEKYQTAELEHNQKVLEQEKSSENQINEEKNKSQEKQLKSVKDAQADVNQSRTEWQNELNKTETDFAKKSSNQAKTTLGNIKTEKSRGEAAAQGHIDYANKEALKKKEVADKDAKAKKAEEDKKSGGFFGWVADKATAFINALKDALNFIFTKLREAVKVLFEAAKKLVLAALEIARKAIVGFIKGFASLLKGFLDFALAAFPGIRDRLKAKIDKYVAVAEKFVNETFEVFKKAVVAIIDFLAEAVDTLIGALQDLYNLILDVVNFIVSGIIKILEFIFNLNVAAAMSVLEFFGALAEEALGGNPAKPLQDVEVPTGQEKAWASAMGAETESKVTEEGKSSINDAIPVLTKSKLDDDDVVLEPYPAVSVDKDFMKSLPDLKDGEKLELGGAGSNSVTTKQFQGSAAFDAGYSIHNEEENMEQVSSVAETADQTQKDSKPDWRHMSDEEKLKEYNDQMLVQSAKEGDAEPSSQKATPEATEDNSPEALITKTGRLNAGRRLQFMGEQMLTGIKVFWNKYKAWIIAGFVAALVAIAAILIFSGGAALGAVVSALGEALTLIFGAIAVYRAMGMLWDYVKKAWAGDKEGAAKSLATAFAIIVVEFFIEKIMAGMGKVYKRMLKAFKANKLGRAARTTLAFVKRTQRRTRDLLKKGMTRLRGTRVAIYLEKITVKGANKLDDLRNKILTKFGFKKIWLEKHGKFIQLWGEFNPKVLLMEEGELTSRDLTEEELLEIKNRRLDNKVIGEKLDNGGVVVSDSFAKDFMEGKSSKTLDDLQNMDAEDIRKLSGNVEGTKELRKGIGGLQPKNFQAHHVIPRELEKTFSNFFSDIGFNIENGKINGIMVPPSDEVLRVAKLDVDIPIGNEFDDYARHLGSHPDYTRIIEEKIIKIERDFRKGALTEEKAYQKLIDITNSAKNAIKNGNGSKVNDLIF
ncbi:MULTISPECIES: AHH domain-containing protein [Chryseobacterium]|uniref:AHH domain-containing protein n=1 Tax=Chryseobacterium TaxID=59732 RepID=UPI00195D9EC2|nr:MULTISPECIES: AHH domain-containing protein [Chryseobacterium]MBM7419447.1 ElaB/YqjD/DUF883 family membrane-anchored ribosome-binding protein [Chryseobacterium sp. JUb44]MDH6209374.1 ElaB/YqjD/DUF883 family membrane-anchored ribosome-binding protein [Chryseobacterium sp. BIGb0186]WSO12211.1 AHH domain-containing protein [Chryseobacterium scophthalmum]